MGTKEFGKQGFLGHIVSLLKCRICHQGLRGRVPYGAEVYKTTNEVATWREFTFVFSWFFID